MAQLRGKDRAEFVGRMFDRIAGRYDFLNTVMTGGRHYSWRTKSVELLEGEQRGLALDVATGTGDFAFDLLNKSFELDLNTSLDLEASGQAIANNIEYHHKAVKRFLDKEPSLFDWEKHKTV